MTHFVYFGIKKLRSKDPSTGIYRIWGSSAGSVAGAPFAGGAFFFAFLSAAAAFSAASFLLWISASVSSLSSYLITFGSGTNSSLMTDYFDSFKSSSSVNYYWWASASYWL